MSFRMSEWSQTLHSYTNTYEGQNHWLAWTTDSTNKCAMTANMPVQCIVAGTTLKAGPDVPSTDRADRRVS